MTLTLRKKKHFLKNREDVRKIILKEVRKEKAIIFGARSVNKQVPKFLREHTEDYDILSDKDPKRLAKRIEKRLDKRFGGNFYEVKAAIHEGTHKVNNRFTGKGVADVSKREGKVPFIKRKGVKFAKLSFQEKKIRESLANPEAKFRHQKDRFSRTRIKLAKKQIPKRKVKRNNLSTDFKDISNTIGIEKFGI